MIKEHHLKVVVLARRVGWNFGRSWVDSLMAWIRWDRHHRGELMLVGYRNHRQTSKPSIKSWMLVKDKQETHLEYRQNTTRMEQHQQATTFRRSQEHMTYTITKSEHKTSRVCNKIPTRREFSTQAAKCLVIYLLLPSKMEVWAQSRGRTFQAARIRITQITIRTTPPLWLNKEVAIKQSKVCWLLKRPEYNQSPTHELELAKTTEHLISCLQVDHWLQTHANRMKWTSSIKTNPQFNKWRRTISRTSSSF